MSRSAGTSRRCPILTPLFAPLSGASRLRLVFRRRAGERSVDDLMPNLGLPQRTVSHHLALLRQMGIVARRRDGKRHGHAREGGVT